MSTENKEQEILLQIVRTKVIDLMMSFEKGRLTDESLKKVFDGPNEEPEETYSLTYSKHPNWTPIKSLEDVQKIAKSWSVKVTLKKDSGKISIEINQHRFENTYENYLSSANTDIERWLEYADTLFSGQK